MSIQIKDTLSPHLAAMARRFRDRKPILEAMGASLVATTARSFREANLRAAPWPPKRDGSPATLYKNGPLKQSIRITSVSNDSVTVGSDRKYAAIHQLGGVIRPKSAKVLRFISGGQVFFRKKVTIPARPFFPFIGNRMTDFAQRRIEAAVKAKVAALMRRP